MIIYLFFLLSVCNQLSMFFFFQHIDTIFLSSISGLKKCKRCGTIFYNFRHKNLVIHYPESILDSYNFDGFLLKIFIKNYYKLIIIFSQTYQQQFLMIVDMGSFGVIGAISNGQQKKSIIPITLIAPIICPLKKICQKNLFEKIN